MQTRTWDCTMKPSATQDVCARSRPALTLDRVPTLCWTTHYQLAPKVALTMCETKGLDGSPPLSATQSAISFWPEASEIERATNMFAAVGSGGSCP